MGTSNFHNVNASNIYAVLMSYDQPVLDDEGNETDEFETYYPECWECDEFIEDTKELAEAKALTLNVGYHHRTNSDPYELRSYPSTELFQFYKQKSFGDIEVTVNINCVLRSGYYDGANLDWFVDYDVCNEVTDEIDFLFITGYYSTMPVGMIRLQTKNAEKWAERTAEELINFTEEFFAEMSMPLAVSARFSNGETWYSKI